MISYGKNEIAPIVSVGIMPKVYGIVAHIAPDGNLLRSGSYYGRPFRAYCSSFAHNGRIYQHVDFIKGHKLWSNQERVHYTTHDRTYERICDHIRLHTFVDGNSRAITYYADRDGGISSTCTAVSSRGYIVLEAAGYVYFIAYTSALSTIDIVDSDIDGVRYCKLTSPLLYSFTQESTCKMDICRILDIRDQCVLIHLQFTDRLVVYNVINDYVVWMSLPSQYDGLAWLASENIVMGIRYYTDGGAGYWAKNLSDGSEYGASFCRVAEKYLI